MKNVLPAEMKEKLNKLLSKDKYVKFIDQVSKAHMRLLLRHEALVNLTEAGLLQESELFNKTNQAMNMFIADVEKIVGKKIAKEVLEFNSDEGFRLLVNKIIKIEDAKVMDVIKCYYSKPIVTEQKINTDRDIFVVDREITGYEPPVLRHYLVLDPKSHQVYDLDRREINIISNKDTDFEYVGNVDNIWK